MKPGRMLFVVCIISAVCFSLVVLKPAVSSARSVTLKVSHQFAAGDVRDKMGRVFGDMVTERTKGEVKFRHYPSSSLFKAKEQWDGMRKGVLDMA